MKDMEEIYGLEFDRGKIRGLLSLEKSQKTAAITEQQAEIDTRWGGKALTTVRLTPKTDDWTAGLDLMANKTSELKILWQRFIQAEYPGDRLVDLEKVLDAAQADGTFPCIVNRPIESLISAGIGKNSGVIRALVGAPEAPTFVGSLFQILSTAPGPRALPTGWQDQPWGSAPAAGSIHEHMADGTVTGRHWTLRDVTLVVNSAFTNKKESLYLVLVPLQEGGAAPFIAKVPGFFQTGSIATRGNDSQWELTGKAGQLPLTLQYPLKWSITYMQNDVPLASPVKTLVAGAAISHLLTYLDGQRPNSGCHVFNGATPIDIIRRILGYLYRQAVDRYMFNPADKFWDGDDAKLIKAILDFCYAVDRRTQLMAALAARPDVTLFMDSLLLSGLVKGTAKGQITMPPVDDEFAGWLVRSILAQYTFPGGRVPATGPTGGAVTVPSIVGGPFAGVVRTKYVSMPKGLTDAEKQAWQAAFPEPGAGGAGLPAPFTLDYVSTDYVATSLVSMLREAIPIILTALRGEWPGISVIQYSDNMIDLDVTVSILEALEYALRMDSSSIMSKAKFTLPYRTLYWASMYATFSCRVPRKPVSYGITDLTAGLSAQAQAFAALFRKQGKNAAATLIGSAQVGTPPHAALSLSLLSSIFQYGGFSYLRYGPDLDQMIRDELAPDVELPDTVYGATIHLPDGNRWLTNAPTSHGDVEVAVIVPCWDASAWRIYMEYLQAETLKSYFAFPVTDQICSTREIDVDINRLSSWTVQLMKLLRLPTGLNGHLASSVRITYPSFPALFDIGLLIPYIREFEHQKLCAEDLDHSMEIELDADMSLWNTSGTLILPEAQVAVAGVAPWRVPNFAVGFAGKHTPSGVYSMPIVFNAQR